MARPDPYDNPKSLRVHFRRRRFQRVARLVDEILAQQDTCRILDLGGSEKYWMAGAEYLRAVRDRLEITLVNLESATVVDSALFRAVQGDACDLRALPDHAYDLVHSNSVIEHVGSWTHMKRMAGEVRRLAPHYFVQTPNFWFPLEPHYASIGFHWMPQSVQVWRMLQRRHGFIERMPDVDAATAAAQSTTLLDERQFRYLFPDARMEHETFFGLTKSLIAVR
jgi:hypothetical protein